MSQLDRTWVAGVGLKTALLCLLTVSVFLTVRAEAAEIEELMAALSFSSEDLEAVRAGKFVSARLKSASDRELAIALAVKLPIEPQDLVAILERGGALSLNPKVKHFGVVRKPVGTEDLADITLGPDQIDRWRNAVAGEDINLSEDEFGELRTERTSTRGEPAPVAAIQEAARQILYSRMRLYQISGLDGIAPYRRSDGNVRDPAHEIRLASVADRGIGLLPSEFYDVLLGYPDRIPAQFQEVFFWALEEGPGGRLVNLTHRFAVAVDGGFGIVQRQFFVTAGYNMEQAVSRIFSVKGGSILLYTNRTSTDAVGGFGGSARRGIGDRMLEGELKSVIRSIIHSASEKPD